MERPDWNSTYMNICSELSKRSTCLRLQTACIIVKNNVIISVGYNGVPSKQKHCCDYWRENNPFSTMEDLIKSDFFYREHHVWSTIREIHGEMNAILFAGKNGISLQDSTLYTLYSPCIQCAKAILTAGIKNIYYKYIYKRNTDGIAFLTHHLIQIEQL